MTVRLMLHVIILCGLMTQLSGLHLQEKDSLSQASELLQKLGYKGNIMENTASKEDS